MPPYIWMLPYVWMAPCIFGCSPYSSLYVWTPCLDDVWMAPVHTQHKESMLCLTRGVHMPPYIWMPSVCLDAAICLDGPLNVWATHMFGHPSYVWMPPACLVLPFGHPTVWSDTPLCLDTPLYVECPPYVWLPPVCLDAPQMYGASKGMRNIKTYGGVQTYRGHPNV